MSSKIFNNTKINVEFDEDYQSRTNINSGENISSLFAKIRRFIVDLKSVAFSGSYNDLSDKPTTATTKTDGLMSATDKTKLDSADDTYALKSKYGDTTINVGRKADTVVGDRSTAEGLNTTASSLNSHAEGGGTTASGVNSHAEGGGTTASGVNSHAEGLSTTASGYGSHSEGWYTEASGYRSHAEGYGAIASGHSSHAEGHYTIATKEAEHASGKFNLSNNDTLFSVGDGIAEDTRHNAFEITIAGGKLHDEEIMTQNKVSNPNLLINPDFKINQRGKSGTIIPNKNSDGNDIHTYFVDRWGVDSGSVTVNTDGTLTLNGTISQILENAAGTNVTASVSAGAEAAYDNSTKTFTITGSGVTVSWAKLEIGSTATPFIAPDPATELMKCKMYYQRISNAYRHVGVGFIQSSNTATGVFPLPQELRITSPTINFVGKTYLWYKDHIGSSAAISTQTASAPNVSQITLAISFKLDTNADASYIGLPCLVQFRDATSYIEIDAEL